jgi:hypothetical protein
LLYIRLDKNRNGRIDFDEFVDELKVVWLCMINLSL